MAGASSTAVAVIREPASATCVKTWVIRSAVEGNLGPGFENDKGKGNRELWRG